GGRHPASLECPDLVLHERDERRDDEGGPAQERRRELVDEALAATRGRDEQEPPRGEEALDGLPLAGAEARVAEPAEPALEIVLHGFGDGACPGRVRGRGHSAARPELCPHSARSLARTSPRRPAPLSSVARPGGPRASGRVAQRTRMQYRGSIRTTTVWPTLK